MLRKVSIAFQLAIGLLVTFCIIVMMKQIYFLTNTDLGWERKGIATINLLYPDIAVYCLRHQAFHKLSIIGTEKKMERKV